jgi:hypothetical protein
MARPTVPPTCWKNVRLLVAVPSRATGTPFWTIRVKTANVGPTPRPVTNIQPHRTGSGVVASRWLSMNSPIAMTVKAPKISMPIASVRLTIWPEATALMIRPPSKGRIW